MKILVVIETLDIRGGTHKQVLRLCEFLSKNNEVAIYTKKYDINKTYPEFKNFKIIVQDEEYKKLNAKSRDEFLINLMKDFDIINLHESYSIRLLKVARKLNKKVVMQINDLPHYFSVGVTKKNKLTLVDIIYKFFLKKEMKKVDAITVNVTKNAERVKKCIDRDAKVFYCGVDVNDNLEKHTQMHNEQKINLFSSGVFFPYRNYETIVNVVKKLKENNIDVHLDIMGSTDLSKDYADYIKKMIEDMNLSKDITIWGQVDEKKYIELHNNADIFSFINVDQSWGLAVFEAMSCGLPVIVSNSVGAIELLTDKENAIFVNPKDVDEIYNEIINLKNNKDYYKKISTNASKIVKEFSWENMYSSKMLNLFKELIGE